MTSIVVNDGFGDIHLTAIDDTHWQLTESYTYKTDDGRTITVPAGYITDGASSPFRILITTWGGHYSSACVVHDWLYTNLNNGHPVVGVPTRKDADDILFELMGKSGVNFWVKWGIWFLVRGFGGPGLKGIGVRE